MRWSWGWGGVGGGIEQSLASSSQIFFRWKDLDGVWDELQSAHAKGFDWNMLTVNEILNFEMKWNFWEVKHWGSLDFDWN